MKNLINPFNDTGFKIIFGKEKDKIILISFLNALLVNTPFYEEIVDITYNNTESYGDDLTQRTVINDIVCTTHHNKKFILEMQNRSHINFHERMLFYNCRSLVDQAKRGEWDFYLRPVYSICFTQFVVDQTDPGIVIDRGWCNLRTGQPVDDLQRLIYIQLPQFTITRPEDCKTELDKWLFSLINMTNMTEIPFAARDNAFKRLQQVANYASLTKEEQERYRYDEKQYLNIINIERSRYKEGLAEGKAEGLAEGKAEGRNEMVLKMVAGGMDIALISRISGYSPEQIEELFRRHPECK